MANRAFSCANATHGSMTDTDTEMVDSVAGGSRGLEALRTDRGPSWDVLTKPLERKRFVELVEHMMNTANQVMEGSSSSEKERGGESQADVGGQPALNNFRS